MTSEPSEVHADRALVDASLRGVAAAIEQLAQRLRCVPRILGAWNYRLGRPLDEHDLADLAQDVTVIILQKLDEYAGRAPFEAWAYRICRLELLNGVRRKDRSRRTSELDLKDVPSADDAGANPFDPQLLHGALERLGGVEAETIRIKHFEGLTFEAVGVRLGIPTNTAKTRYYRGMLRLEKLLRSAMGRSEPGGER